MTINELGRILNNMYDDAINGDKVVMVHLFGIKYANEIKNQNYSIKDIIKSSKLNESYSTELSKGIKLSKYVELKNDSK